MDTETGPDSGQEQQRAEPPDQPPQAEAAPHGHPTSHLEPARPLDPRSDHDLSRIGFWSLALGGLGLLVGITFLAAGGILPGALVTAVALMVAGVGALVLLVVADHSA